MPLSEPQRRLACLCACCAVGLVAPRTLLAQDDAAPEAPAPEVPADGPVDEAPEHRAPDPVPDVPAESELSPPRVLEAVEAEIPAGHLPEGEPVVVLHVTIEADGSVSDAHPEGEHDEALDGAAREALAHWRFAPATRGGVAIRSRVRVAVRFALPEFVLDETGAHAAESTPEIAVDAASVETDDDDDEPEHALGVEALVDPITEAAAPRTSSTYDLDRVLLDAAPHRDGADLLSSAPGVYVARGEGDGVAHSIFLRGFDAEHGQDLELTLGGVPLNLPSHLHGQGYADLGFLVPEAVLGVRVVEGVYDPRQGDFATAGSIDFRLGVPERSRGVHLSATYGSFDTFRAVAMFAPRGEREGSFVAATYRTSSGFGAQRGGNGGSAIAQWIFGDARTRVRVLGFLTGGRYGMAGVLRRDDVDAGRVDFLGAYAFPTAAPQSGFSIRALASGTVSVLGANASFAELTLWAGYADFRLLENFTGYVESSRTMPEWRGRGDLIEQRDEHVSLGLSARWRSEPWTPFEWASARIEVGVSGRLDLVTQAQNLLEAPLGQTWDRRVEANIRGVDVGLYVDLDVRLTEYVRIRGGLRGDALYYDVDDTLGNFIPAFRRDSYIAGYRRSASGLALGPRVAVEVLPLPELSFTLAYGEGYRSPQARQLADGESAPFAKVRGGDLGGRLSLGDHHELDVSVSGFVTQVSSDIAFDPSEGRLEALGPSTRLGFSAAVSTRPWEYLTGSLSVTYVQATLDAPPLASAEDPDPPYQPGQLLPYVAPWVIRADVSTQGPLVHLGDWDVRGRIGVGFSFLSPRPLPFGAFAEPVALLDAQAGLSWGPVDLGVTMFNLTDSRYGAIEYSFASNWSPDTAPSRLPARHFSAGAPLTVLGTLGVTL